MEAKAIEELEGQRGELPFGTVSVSSVGISKDAVQVVVSQPRFSVGTAEFIGFSFAEITVGSATV